MLGIIKSIFIKNFRAPAFLLFSAIFPIILTVVIGNLVTDAMDTRIELEPKTIYYLDNGDEKNSKVLNDIATNMESDEFKFSKVSDEKVGMDKVEKEDDIFINLNKAEMDIYVDSEDEFYYNYISAFITAYEKRGEAITLAINENPVIAQEILNDAQVEGVEKEILTGEKSPIGVDYYAVTQIVMIAMYLMCFALDGYFFDRRKKITDRIKLSGTSNLKYIVSTTIGYFLLSFLVTGPGVLFSKYVIGVNWGENTLLCYLGIQIVGLLSIVIGTLLAFIFDEKEKVFAIIQGAVIPTLSFLGGAYVAIDFAPGTKLGLISNISPIKVISEGIFASIYEKDNTLLINGSFIYIAIAIVLILVTVKVMDRKQEARI
ncbi:MAG: ABC transporter permease [Sarcina sp.]